MPLQERALKARREFLGEDHPHTRESYRAMGALLEAQGKLVEAAPYYRAVLERGAVLPGNARARVLRAEGNFEEGEAFLRSDLERARRIGNDDGARVVRILDKLGSLLHDAGRLAEAEQCFREAVEISRGRHNNNPEWTAILGNFSAVLVQEGKLDEAEPLCVEVLDKTRKLRGESHPETLQAVIMMGMLLGAQGKHAPAAALLTPAVEPCRAAFTGSNTRTFASLLIALAHAHAALGRFDRAEVSLLEAHAALAAAAGEPHADTRACAQRLVDLYNAWNAADRGKGHDTKAAAWKARLVSVSSPPDDSESAEPGDDGG